MKKKVTNFESSYAREQNDKMGAVLFIYLFIYLFVFGV